MKSITLLLMLATAALSGGCVSFKGVARAELPVTWTDALPKARATAPDVAGTYIDRGQIFGIDTGQSLAELLFDPKQFEYQHPLQIELRRPDADHLRVIVTKWDGVGLADETFATTVEKSSGAVVFRRSDAAASGRKAGLMVVALTGRLWKGSEGCLYGQLTTYAAGVTFLVPIAGRAEQWGRWERWMPPK